MLNKYIQIIARQSAPDGRYQCCLSFKKNSFATEASFSIKPFLLHKLSNGPATNVKVTSQEAADMYKKMKMIRQIETAAASLYKEKKIRGFCHLYSGQEAVAVGMKSVMRPNDSIISAYRIHGWAYLQGVSLVGILAELTGRKSGCCRGKGGSMHMYYKNFYGGNGIVGAQVPIGAGIAFANKYKGSDAISFTLFGDGAANQGQVFEVYNMAKLWDLPVVFVCENNGYGMGTSAERSSAIATYYTRGDYIPGIWVDGMDVLAVKEATKFVIAYALSDKGHPIIMEAATYRYHGHSMSDPGTSYRSREEIQQVRKTRDPISNFKNKIIEAKLVTDADIKKWDGEIKKEVDAAIKIAKADTEIKKEELAFDVYAKSIEKTIRGTTPFEQFNHKNLTKPYNL